jgi:hypothetical protein
MQRDTRVDHNPSNISQGVQPVPSRALVLDDQRNASIAQPTSRAPDPCALSQASNRSFQQPMWLARLTIDERISFHLAICIIMYRCILQQLFLVEYTTSTVGSVVREILFLSQIVEV